MRLGWLATNTLRVTFWHSLRVLCQLAWVLLLARALGVTGYGTYSGVAGLAIALSGLVGLGLGLRLYQDVARVPELFALRWHEASRGWMLSIVPVALLFIAIGKAMFPQQGWDSLVLIGMAELAFSPWIAQVASAYAAHSRVSAAAAVPVVGSVGRVCAVACFLFFVPGQDLNAYALFHACALGLATLILVAACKRSFRPARQKVGLGWESIRSGLGLSTVWTSAIAWSSLDKTFALRWGGDHVAGNFTAAQRFTSLATLPMEALVASALPRMFRRGAGSDEHAGMMPALLCAAIVYGAIAAVAIYLVSDAIPWLLGSDFTEASLAARWLALYVPASCLKVLLVHSLLARGDVRWRIATECAGLGLMVCGMLFLLPEHGTLGAVYALTIAEYGVVALVSVRLIVTRKWT
ncbi:lipopolysaccharide biosynthesis protein [Pseudoxanthomonas mexicana]